MTSLFWAVGTFKAGPASGVGEWAVFLGVSYNGGTVFPPNHPFLLGFPFRKPSIMGVSPIFGNPYI